MPQGSLRIDQRLTNLTVQYKNNDAIFPKFLPEVSVQLESGTYFIYAPDFRLPETKRANKAQSNMITWSASTSSYQVSEHALKDIVSDRDIMNADSVFDLRADTTENLTDVSILRQEYEVAKLLFTTATWGGNASLNTATSWVGNTTTCAPVSNVLSATNYGIKNGGVRFNTGILGKGTFDALKENTILHERIKYVERSILTEELLAALFEMQNIYVGTMIYDVSQEGQTNSITYVWPDHAALFAYFEPARRKTKSAAVSFRVAQYGNPYRVKRWRDEGVEGDYIEVQTMFVPKAVATSSAYFFSSVTGV